MTPWKPPTSRRVRALRYRLRELYGQPVERAHGDGLGELVLTVLSQSTSDRNRDVAYLRLRERFVDWGAVARAPVAEIEKAIRPGGLSRQKSARIAAMLRELGDPPSLDHLPALGLERARGELCGLPGVGRKTTACVLLFSYGMPDIPVDTHVGRVGARLGLLRPGAGSEELHDSMLALTPRGGALELHVNILRHGRRTCHARVPRCDECALRRMCPRVGVA